jgi:hypothetical protein
VLFVASALFALEQIQQMDVRARPLIVGLAAIAAGELGGLLWREQRAALPLLPMGLLRQPAIWRSDALAAVTARPSSP